MVCFISNFSSLPEAELTASNTIKKNNIRQSILEIIIDNNFFAQDISDCDNYMKLKNSSPINKRTTFHPFAFVFSYKLRELLRS